MLSDPRQPITCGAYDLGVDDTCDKPFAHAGPCSWEIVPEPPANKQWPPSLENKSG